jgi:predicted nucleotidyltransferase
MDSQLQAILTELRSRLEVHYGTRLVRIVVYGSQARGEAEPGADIDVLVVLEEPVDASAEIARTEFDVAELSLAHDVVITCLFVSREQLEREQSPLLMNVRREGVPV